MLSLTLRPSIADCRRVRMTIPAGSYPEPFVVDLLLERKSVTSGGVSLKVTANRAVEVERLNDDGSKAR